MRRNVFVLSATIVAAGLLGAFGLQSLTGSSAGTWTYSRLVDQAQRGEVRQVEIQGTDAHILTR
ncbi:MAG TPA: hypothetical protein VLW53_12015, partial [Candidatus Eisenbacteria bacterium]|nr:hypothetical protein [Candidatus Eisenbacteria bacterium]